MAGRTHARRGGRARMWLSVDALDREASYTREGECEPVANQSAPVRSGLYRFLAVTARGLQSSVYGSTVRFALQIPSRGGGTRTPGLRFWRPPLYQLSYAPGLGEIVALLDFAAVPGFARYGSQRPGSTDRLQVIMALRSGAGLVSVTFACLDPVPPEQAAARDGRALLDARARFRGRRLRGRLRRGR
jgi:hypothetical protein